MRYNIGTTKSQQRAWYSSILLSNC